VEPKLPPPLPPRFTDKNLYGPGGPKPSDIKQDSFGDCYFVATLSAVAQKHPLLIKGLISYDTISHRFVVGLYDLAGKKKHIHVTQAEILDNVTRGGGSWMDNTGKDKVSWPAVMETAFAKMYDSNPKDGLAEGYTKVVNGGWPKDAMLAVTGELGSELKFVQQPPPMTRVQSIELLGARVARALKNKRAVTLWSVSEIDGRTAAQKSAGAAIAQDGLVDNHVYTVLSMSQTATGAWTVNLRNPWGTNIGVGEGRDSKSAKISVPLDRLVSTGGLNSFRVSSY
jgi:Calpain family cysteine protease